MLETNNLPGAMVMVTDHTQRTSIAIEYSDGFNEGMKFTLAQNVAALCNIWPDRIAPCNSPALASVTANYQARVISTSGRPSEAMGLPAYMDQDKTFTHVFMVSSPDGVLVSFFILQSDIEDWPAVRTDVVETLCGGSNIIKHIYSTGFVDFDMPTELQQDDALIVKVEIAPIVPTLVLNTDYDNSVTVATTTTIESSDVRVGEVVRCNGKYWRAICPIVGDAKKQYLMYEQALNMVRREPEDVRAGSDMLYVSTGAVSLPLDKHIRDIKGPMDMLTDRDSCLYRTELVKLGN